MEILKIYQGDFWASGFEQYEILDMSKWGIFPDNPEPLNPAKYLTEITIDKVDYSQDIFFQFENGYICWYSGISQFHINLNHYKVSKKDNSANNVNSPINNIFDFIGVLNQAQYYTTKNNHEDIIESSGYHVVFNLKDKDVQYYDFLVYFPEFKKLTGYITIRNLSTEYINNYIYNQEKKYFSNRQ